MARSEWVLILHVVVFALWFGTDLGVYCFDGKTFTNWNGETDVCTRPRFASRSRSNPRSQPSSTPGAKVSTMTSAVATLALDRSGPINGFEFPTNVVNPTHETTPVHFELRLARTTGADTTGLLAE